ncbi:hypothetical protein [Leptolyngbya sp. CCY15150]|nr:hypothetical protein [Leptolyngbya sp. CCY15150]
MRQLRAIALWFTEKRSPLGSKKSDRSLIYRKAIALPVYRKAIALH